MVLTETGVVPLEGTLADAKKKGLVAASRVRFLSPGAEAPQEVIYFRAPADNAGLKRLPVVEQYIRHLSPATTFMKSASYLLHTDPFSVMRSAILEASTAILQDDTGVPYRFLKAPVWQVTLYGQYAKPIADFHYGFQRDLEAAYGAGARKGAAVHVRLSLARRQLGCAARGTNRTGEVGTRYRRLGTLGTRHPWHL